VHGRVSVYEPQGRYQLYVDAVAPVGTGRLQLEFEALRQRLHVEGLFAVDRKRPLPERPRAIGVVTSAQGAVWHDIQNVVRRRYPLVELVLAASAVQGPDAPAQLVAGLEALQRDPLVDVIIIGRGGGSPEELAAFNDEDLARAVFRSRVPVVSAVGHETDFSISDFVADLRAPTPSAAAELCVPDQRVIRADLWSRASDAHDIAEAIATDLSVQFREQLRRSERLSPAGDIERHRITIDNRVSTAERRMHDRSVNERAQVALLTERARLLNPRDVLRRGFVAVTALNGTERRILRAGDLNDQDLIRLDFLDGARRARVTEDNQ
jgi:exodeoxyribonuclease VII large subunit